MKIGVYSFVAVAILTLYLGACSQTGRDEVTTAHGPDECCFSFYSKPIPPRAIKGYRTTHPGCKKNAVILITIKDKKLCANPENRNVQIIMDILDDQFGTSPPSSLA